MHTLILSVAYWSSFKTWRIQKKERFVSRSTGHPKGYVSYKGGNNKKSANHYASMKSKGNNSLGNGSTWSNTTNNDRNTANKANCHHNNQVAQNTSRGNGSGHFGRR